MNGDKKIERSGFLEKINFSAKRNLVKIPAICVWEVSMLSSKNRITLSMDTLEWIHAALSCPGISICPLSPEIAYESSNLPGSFHGDPADRMIVASTRILDGQLMTFDRKILEYSKKGLVNVIEPLKY
jgi:PIN domain nuclease of toxin-antitoxin system